MGRPRKEKKLQEKHTVSINVLKEVVAEIDRIRQSPVGRKLGQTRSRDAFVNKILIGFVRKHNERYDHYLQRKDQFEKEYFESDDEKIKSATEGDLDSL